MHSIAKVLALTALLFTAATSLVHATTLQALSLAELAARSQVVVTARVGASTSEWRSGTIHTLTHVEVLQVHKGRAPQVVTVLQLGGRVGTTTAMVAGTARLEDGEVVLLFLRPAGRGEHVLTGMSQGALHVQRDSTLLWAPTAPVWDGTSVQHTAARQLTLEQVLRESGVSP